MKKKRKEESKKWAETREYIGEGGWSVHACNLQKLQRAAKRPELLSSFSGVRVISCLPQRNRLRHPLLNLVLINLFLINGSI
jgi:hypothetical protein